MCPLRIILIFLSATLAGFFVLRNLKSEDPACPKVGTTKPNSPTDEDSPENSSKVCAAIGKGFWTFVDMASGKYLWRNLVSTPSPVSKRAE